MKKLTQLYILAVLLLVGCGGGVPAGGQVLEVEEPVAVVVEVEGGGEPTAVSADPSAPAMGDGMASMSAPQMNSMGNQMGGQTAVASRPLSRQIAQADGTKEEQAIVLVSAHPPIAEVLATYPGWTATSYPEDGTEVVWHVDFQAADGEGLGYGHVNLQTGEVSDFSVPRDLSDEEFEAGRAKIEGFLQNSPEAIALLGDFSLWEHDVWYNKWEENWHAWYRYGLDAWEFVFYIDEGGNVWLDNYYDPDVLEGDEAVAWNRQQAVELSYQAPGLDEALNGYDNWYTYASDQGNGLWTVEFAADEQLLFSVLVDIVNWQVVEGSQ